ncbi:calcium-binding protein [Nocardiopsis lambiniae]|uniref:Calcium-binding protein n=1 Tax=Nocardiopsis lambiniae TaxID=3075539 RepID=A0ABU2M8L8_9ACTN|nr:calcium-binding protein [Nocardiopsis sp. DSM 44743]MDT0329013.1 calcium-binding protein [Nocardiopsis sp. DSM 44743]
MNLADGPRRDDHADEPSDDSRARSRQRGGSPSAIAAALHRPPHPGPQHWGGPRPRKVEPDPFFSSSLVPPPGERFRRR